MNTPGKLQNMIEIYIWTLNKITISSDGKFAEVCGGTDIHEIIIQLRD